MSRTYAIDREDGELEVWLPSQPRIPTLFLGLCLLAYSVPAMMGGTPVVIEGSRWYAAHVPPASGPWVMLVLGLAWLVVGVAPAVAGAAVVGYQFLGWERVRVAGEHVSVRRELLGLGRRRRLPRGVLAEARLVPMVPVMRWFVGTGSIALGAGKDAVRLGGSLKPAEAAEVLRALTAEAATHEEVAADGR